MNYFIGINPPEEYKSRISAFRNKWKNNFIDDIVEPHITLKAQGGLTEDLSWLSGIKKVCAETEPFRIQLSEARFFGEEILYLHAPSNDLHSLHDKLVHAVSPSEELIEKYFELEQFVPHLTLAKTTYGVTKKELKDMAAVAEMEIGPFPLIEVNSIRVYKEEGMNRYMIYKDIPLGGKD